MYSAHSTRSGVGLHELFRPGDHACHFFRSGDEIGELLVPYFKTGLERNELCLWVTAPPYDRDRAIGELRAAVGDFDRRTAAGQISILVHEEWYAQQETATAAERIEAALAVKDKAIAAGYAGLRGSGNTSLLAKKTWDDYMAYERAASEIFKSQPITGLCSYGFDQCSARGVVDVVHCHGHGLAKRHGQWSLFEVRSHGGADAVHRSQGAGPGARREQLRRIVEDQLAVFIGACPERIALKGARVDLSVRQATRLAILLSALTTNAARHGALASPQGRLAVRWHVVANGSRKLHIAWTESGAVNLAVPETVGSGTQLMAGLVESCTRLFSPTGMACEFVLRLDD